MATSYTVRFYRSTGSAANDEPLKSTSAEKRLTSAQRRVFYRSPAWQNARKIRLQKDHYLCQDCLARDVITLAEAVHHEKELANNPELALDIDNLRSLCAACHNRRHGFKGQKTEAVPLPRGVRIFRA